MWPIGCPETSVRNHLYTRRNSQEEDISLYRRSIYATIQEKIVCEHTPSKAWFSSYRLLKIKVNAQRVHLEFGTALSSTTSDRGYLPRLLRHVLPELLQYVDLQTVIHLWCSTKYSSFSSGILECVSGTTDRTRRTNNMACSLACFKLLKLLYLRDIWSLLVMPQKSTT